MKPIASPLPVIQIPEPCSVDWESMQRQNGQKRFCSHCQRSVHDLSAMTDQQESDLVCQSAGRLCVRYEQLPNGGVKTLDYQKRSGGEGRTRCWLIAGAILSLFGGVTNAMWHRRPPTRVFLAGRMVMPTPPAAPTPAGGASSPGASGAAPSANASSAPAAGE